MKLVLAMLLSLVQLGAGASTAASPSFPGPSRLLGIKAFDARQNTAREVPVVIYEPANAAPAKPAVIVLSGCDGSFGEAAAALVEQLRAAGVVVAEVQSISAFGNSCGINVAQVPLQGAGRASHAFLARELLVAANLAAPDNVGLLGFSHGGWTITYVVHQEGSPMPDPAPFAVAVAYYPLCMPLDLPAAKPAVVPTLILAGKDDTWTRPTHCIPLVERSAGLMEMQLYDRATHAFDVRRPYRSFTTSLGFTSLGYDRVATQDSIARSWQFLRRHLKF